MATVDKYKIILDVQGTQAVDTLKQKLTGLGSVIASVGFGAFIAGAMRMADSLKDVADATGLTVGYVKAFSDSLREAGGNADDAGKILSKFYQSIDDAAQGSDKAQRAFEEIGVTLNDLRRLSEQDLLSKTLANLSEMEAGAKRTALGVDLFGKSFANIDPAQLDRILKTKDWESLNAVLTKNAELVGIMEQNYNLLQTTALGTIANLIGSTDNFKLSAEGAAKILKTLSLIMITTFTANLVQTLLSIVTAFVSMARAIAAAGAAQAFLTGLTGVGLALVAAAGVAATIAYNKLAGEIDAAAASITGFNAEAAKTPEEIAAINQGYAAGVTALQQSFAAGRISAQQLRQEIEKLDASRRKALGLGPIVAGATPSGNAGRNVEESDRVKRMKEQAAAAKETTDQLKLQIDRQNTLKQLSLSLVNLDKERADAISDYASIALTANAEIAQLEARIATERAKGRDTNQQVITQLQEQIALTQQNAQAVINIRREEERRAVLQREIARRNQVGNAILAEGAQIAQQLVELANERMVAMGQKTQMQANLDRDLLAAQSENARAIAALEDQMRLAESDKERAHIQTLINIRRSGEEQSLQLIRDRYKQEEELRNSMTAGVVSAFRQISESMSPMMMAQQSVMSIFNNMSSALDTFVQTGKFKFKDFALSIIRDLIAIQARMALVGLFKTIGIAMGFPGLAQGGPAKAGQAYIVGERGPELFVPKTAGDVIPNKEMSSAKPVAMARQEPQRAINYNYTINAVDAKSVAQLFYENRKALYGTVRIAQGELPGRAG